MKLQKFEFGVSDATLANAKNIWRLIFFAYLKRKNLLQSFMLFLTTFHELMKLWSFDWLNCVLTLVTSSAQIVIINNDNNNNLHWTLAT